MVLLTKTQPPSYGALPEGHINVRLIRAFFNRKLTSNKRAALLHEVGKANYNRGMYKKAEKRYNSEIIYLNLAHITKRTARLAAAHNSRGNAKHCIKDHYGALSDYNKAIGLYPNFSEAYYNRGVAKHHLKDYKGALSDYNKAIELDSKNASAYNNRGVAKSDLGDHQGALSDYNTAIELDPNCADFYYNRGNARRLLKDYKDAKNDFLTAARLFEEQGRAEEAKEAMEQANSISCCSGISIIPLLKKSVRRLFH
jgi:tetratricopeptide (TPR) repeat protein